jgi:hypothetical protein
MCDGLLFWLADTGGRMALPWVWLADKNNILHTNHSHYYQDMEFFQHKTLAPTFSDRARF